MKHLYAVLLVGAPSALFFACGNGEIANTGSSTSSSGGNAECPACVADKDCAAGSQCGQFAGDSYCAPSCSTAAPCSADRACTPLTSAEGQQVELCVPKTNVCGGSGAGGAGSTSSTSAAASSSGSSEVCGSLDGPDVTAACTSCKTSGKPCQANGCYGGWWCNKDTNACQAPPAPCGSTSSSSTSSSSSSSTSSSTSSGGTGSVGANGGTVDLLRFAIVGDTRPPSEDDTAGYPTAVITKIWQDIEAHSPKPYFAVTTGDYQFANPFGSQSTPQLTAYLTARANFTNIVFPAMGNHECTGGTATNCGPGTSYSTTNNLSNFLSKMINPLGKTQPYYSININGTGNAWTAKFVFVACNYWSSAQATWLDSTLAAATTYTFVVRHMGSIANTGPCLSGSSNNAAQIMGNHPLTLLIAGHTHTFSYYPSEKQIIVGNGGAPLSGGVNYGYVIAEAATPGGPLTFKEYDYSTNASQMTFTVNP